MKTNTQSQESGIGATESRSSQLQCSAHVWQTEGHPYFTWGQFRRCHNCGRGDKWDATTGEFVKWEEPRNS